MAIIKSNEVFKGVHYLLWKIEEDVEELKSGLIFSDADEQKLSAIHHPEKKKEFLALRQLLLSFFGENQIIFYNSNGKPFLKNSNIPISFSHTNGFAGILIGAKEAVGLDLEVKRENILKIAPRFMNDQESASLSPHYHAEHLLFYWGAKEAIVKIEDDKKLNFKRSIAITPFNYSENCQTTAQLNTELLRTNYDLIFENLGGLLITCGLKKS